MTIEALIGPADKYYRPIIGLNLYSFERGSLDHGAVHRTPRLRKDRAVQSESKRAGAGGGDPSSCARDPIYCARDFTYRARDSAGAADAGAGAGDAGVQDPVYRMHDLI